MTNNPIRIVAVEYLNTLPFIKGLEDMADQSWFRLIRANPSDCARIMKEGKAEVGLIPVAAIPELGDVQVFSPYCIGADGAVDTVGIFSDRPLEELETILLDYQSRTSVVLCRLLIEQYWSLEGVELVEATSGYEEQIRSSTGGLVIGDRVFDLKREKVYFHDLGAAWKDWTGLPFAFALWLIRPELSKTVRTRLTRAFERGMKSIHTLQKTYSDQLPDSVNYFEESISYGLDREKRKAVALFLKKTGHAATARKIFPLRQQEFEG